MTRRSGADYEPHRHTGVVGTEGLAGGSLRLRQAAHDGAQAEVAWQVREEAAEAEGLAGVELYLATGEVGEDGAGGVDRGLPFRRTRPRRLRNPSSFAA